jgi:hypothetical protein
VLDGLIAQPSPIKVGERNDTLYRFALEQAIYADDYETLLDVVRTRNMDCDFPLPNTSIVYPSPTQRGVASRRAEISSDGVELS